MKTLNQSESLARQNISWLAPQPPRAPQGKGMTWANIPCGDSGDLSRGSVSKDRLLGLHHGRGSQGQRSLNCRTGACDSRRGRRRGKQSDRSWIPRLVLCPPEKYAAVSLVCMPWTALVEEKGEALQPDGLHLNPRHSLTSWVMVGSLLQSLGFSSLGFPALSEAHGKWPPPELSHSRY